MGCLGPSWFLQGACWKSRVPPVKSLLPGAELTSPAQALPPEGCLPPKKGECSARLERRNPSPTTAHCPWDNKRLSPPW